MEQKVKKRGWVKNAAIIFLSIMLVLTFFSNTIMNRSLPEVAAQYAQSGTINAKVRGSGTITANETYQVMATDSRKVQSVAVSLGDEVKAGDLLLVLSSGDSEELETTRSELETAELEYQKALINASSADYAKQNRDIQNAREDLEAAQATLAMYEPVDPAAIKAAQDKVNAQKTTVAAAQAALDAAQAALDAAGGYQPGTPGTGSAEAERQAYEAAKNNYNAVYIRYGANYRLLEEIAKAMVTSNKDDDTYKSYTYTVWMEALADDFKGTVATTGNITPDTGAEGEASLLSLPTDAIDGVFSYDSDGTHIIYKSQKYVMEELAEAYTEVTDAKAKQDSAYQAYQTALENTSGTGAQNEKEYKAVQSCQKVLNDANTLLTSYQNTLDQLTAQQTQYNEAKSNVETLEDTLSDLIFALQEQQKADGKTQAIEALDLKAMRNNITRLREKVQGMEGGTGGEIRSETAGIVRTINVTAGNTTTPESALMEIEVPDRGYQLSFSVEADKARMVTVGDTAELTNYWGPEITAVLTSIRNDPQSAGGQNKLLVFSISGEEVSSGTTLNLSVGARSANYDVIVPKSAVHSDTNGEFVYVLEVTSTPLGNRFTATKVDVKVLAQDDVNAAVSGGVAANDYVITTSNTPITAGMKVRIAENVG